VGGRFAIWARAAVAKTTVEKAAIAAATLFDLSLFKTIIESPSTRQKGTDLEWLTTRDAEYDTKLYNPLEVW
jgi:hypothetical protein